MIQWLEKHGSHFKGVLSPYKTSYPKTQHYLYFSGSEKAYPYSSLAKPAPRGHRMVHDGFSGAGIAKALLDGARRVGVQIVPASKVEKILLAKDGSVRGVEYLTLSNSASALTKHEKLTNRLSNTKSRYPPLQDGFITVSAKSLSATLSLLRPRRPLLSWRLEASPTVLK